MTRVPIDVDDYWLASARHNHDRRRARRVEYGNYATITTAAPAKITSRCLAAEISIAEPRCAC